MYVLVIYIVRMPILFRTMNIFSCKIKDRQQEIPIKPSQCLRFGLQAPDFTGSLILILHILNSWSNRKGICTYMYSWEKMYPFYKTEDSFLPRWHCSQFGWFYYTDTLYGVSNPLIPQLYVSKIPTFCYVKVKIILKNDWL